MSRQAWRVRPLPRPCMAVEIDGWYELAIEPADVVRARTDLIVERPVLGGREYRVMIGHVGVPAIPEGFAPIAVVHVPAATPAIYASNIGDAP